MNLLLICLEKDYIQNKEQVYDPLSIEGIWDPLIYFHIIHIHINVWATSDDKFSVVSVSDLNAAGTCALSKNMLKK